MVKSPKTGRELKPSRVYLGPKWLAHLVHGRPGDESDENEGPERQEEEEYHSNRNTTTVKSPKTGRELEGQKGYRGPQWLAKLVRKYVAKKPEDDS